MEGHQKWITASFSIILSFVSFIHSESDILLIVDGNNVIRSDAWGSQLDYIITDVDGIADLDFDLITDTLYWTNPVSDTIQKAYIGDGVEPSSVDIEDFVSSDIGYLDSVALDWLHRNLYWTDKERGEISMIGLNGSGRKVIVTGIQNPHKIVVDPMEGKLYWIDEGDPSASPSTVKIERCQLDGSVREDVLTNRLDHPTALAIDYADPRVIYYADLGKNNIQKSGTTGWSRHVMVSKQKLYEGERVVQSTESLSVGSQYIYWTEPDRQILFYTTKSAGSDVKAITGNFVRPTAVHVFHDYRQPVDQCSLAGGCNAEIHVCADDPSGPYLCSCLPGTDFSEDTHKCENIDECEYGLDGCSHYCIDTDGSFKCDCASGFEAVNNTECVDINECETNVHRCEQICNNEQGGYTCNCRQGYRLQSGGINCEEVRCDTRLTYHNVIVQCGPGPYLPGHACLLACESGQLFGPTTIFCGASGVWIEPSELPFCYGENTKEISWDTITIQVNPGGVLENSPLNTVVGQIDLVVPEVYGQLDLQSLSFSLNTTGVPFSVENTSPMAVVKLTGIIDYELQSMYNITLTAELKYNGVKHTLSNKVIIYISDVNEPPSEPELTRYSIPETLRYGGIVAKFVTTDPDRSRFNPKEKQRLEYVLLNATDSNHRRVTKFGAQDNQGIVLWGRLDYETSPYYTLAIKVQDTGIPPLSATSVVNITVIDINEVPTDIILSGTRIKEIPNESHNMSSPMVGTLTAIDPDDPTSEYHKFRVVKDEISAHHADCFKVMNTTLHNGSHVFALFANDPTCFDFEKLATLQTSVEVTDKFGLTFQKTFVITVDDVEERPSNIFLTGSQVMEHSPLGMVIGMVFVKDPDSNDQSTLSLLYSTNNWISLTGSSLKVSGDIDYEQKRTITVTMKATDQSGLELTKNLTITVLNERHGPKIVVEIARDYQCEEVTEVNLCIAEDAPAGTSVATVTTTDTEEYQNVTMWMFDSSGSFQLSGNSITVKPNKLNFESGVRNIALTLTAIDKQGDMTVQTITVKVLDANDVPSEVRLSNSILRSDVAVGDTVGKLSCVDEDYTDTHSFTLLSNPGNLFELDEHVLKVSSELDGNEFPIVLTCTDGKSTSKISHLTIEKSTDTGSDNVISLDSTEVLENLKNGSLIGTISVSSQTSLNMFHISLENVEFLPFGTQSLSSTSAGLFLTDTLNFEEKHSYDIVVKARSLVTRSISFKNFTIKVINVPEAIELERRRFKECPPYTWITEVAVVGTALNTNYNFTIIESTLPLQLTNATSSTVVLTNSAALDYESEKLGRGQEYNLTILAVDTSNALIAIRQTFLVKIVNVNEAPNNVTLTSWIVLENTAPRQVVSQLIVSDPDLPFTRQKFHCDFIRNDFGWFYIDNELAIRVQKDASIDYEHAKFARNAEKHIDHLVFECWDQGGMRFVSEPLELEIKDVNEAPTDMSYSGQKLNIAENLPPGTKQYISRFSVTDPDWDDTHNFTIEPRNEKRPFPKGLFEFDEQTLYATETLNFENRTYYKVTVTATDRGGLTFVKKLQINVLDANDPPTRIYVPSYAHILEHQPLGTIFTYLYTEDEDFDQGHTYLILEQSPPNAVHLIDNNKIAAFSARVLDYEMYKAVNLTIQSVDEGSPSMSITQNLSIPIENVHEAPTQLILSENHVIEGASAGTVVANITIVDPDGPINQPYYYLIFLTDTAGGRFSVEYNWDSQMHQVLVNFGGDSLNYEQQSQYNITIFTIDFGTTLTSTMTIYLVDRNDPPKGLIFEAATSENGMPAEPDVKSFADMTTEEINRSLVVSESVGLSVAVPAPIAYIYIVDEDMAQGDINMDNYQLTISSMPPLNETASRSRREINPRIKRRSNADFTSPTVSSFSIATVDGSRWLTLWSSLSLDYEAQSQYDFYITCTDRTMPDTTFTQKVSLLVKNVEEPPYSVTLQENSVTENQDRSLKIGTLNILDQDEVPVYVTSVVQSADHSFYLNDLDLYTRQVFNFEEKNSYFVNISVMEVAANFGRPFFYTIEVMIQDEPEPPCCLSFDDTSHNRKQLPTSVAMGDTVGMLSVVDPDISDKDHTFEFEIVSAAYQENDFMEYFKMIGPNQLVINKALPDTSARAVYEVIIRTQDSTALGYKGRVYVTFLGDCGGRQCHSSATCVDMEDGSSSCQCKEGYSGNGEVCTAINACEQNPCLNGGVCFSGSHGTYLCDCSTDFTGLNCELSRTVCNGVRCPYNGICVPGGEKQSYSCHCTEPYRKDCSGCIQTKNGVCDPSLGGAKNDKVTGEEPDKQFPSYLPIIIGVCVGVIILAVIIGAVVYHMCKAQRHKVVHSRIRFNSEASNLQVISGHEDFKEGTEPSQFSNPLYDRADVTAHGDVHPSDVSKAPLDDLHPDTVNLDMNENPPAFIRTLSQQEEILFCEGKESVS